ncbi:MAG: DUF2787 family protein [Magnetococcales bacterium]|nr:DUF2787 family protein [Magnetococcales bacterium]
MFTVLTGIQVYPIHISQKMGQMLTRLIHDSGVNTSGGVIVNFRDPEYSAETGGYHPVEVGIDPLGKIHYVTDFSFVGPPGYAELEKQLDWDIRYGAFQHQGREYQITQGRSMYQIWERNFLAYVGMGVFKVQVTGMGME